MDQELRTQVILSAVQAVGPEPEGGMASGIPWAAAVAQKAAEIAAMCVDGSAQVKAIESIFNSKVFPATILAVTKERSSTRGLVKLGTRSSVHHPDGIEEARTERTDNPSGLAMARKLRALVGHKVLLWVEVEAIGDGARKVRVVRHVEDRGPAEEHDTAPAEAAG